MDIEYIIVQAGGKGTRMEYLTANKPKALVPIDNLPMLFYLFRKYPDKKFLIISDYKIDVMRRYLSAFAEVDYLVIDATGKTGTCAGLKAAVDKIPESDSFLLIWSDLVLPKEFQLPEKADNYIGISKDFRCRWSYQDGNFQEIPSENTGVAGFFLFKDKHMLMDVPLEGEFVKWLREQDIAWNTVGLYHTREYGLIAEYKQQTAISPGRCRPFNKMTVLDHKIVKEGIDSQGKTLAKAERNWYRFAVNKGFHNTPKIYEYEPKLIMQKIQGKNIYEYTDLTTKEKKDILEKLVITLKELHSYGSCSADYFSIWNAYVKKTWARLDKIRDLIPFGNQEFITVNGRKCHNIFFCKQKLEALVEHYECPGFSLIHGDNTFSNMMLDEHLSPILIDPRGYFGKTALYGDAVYDWAKLYYSLAGNYDQFNLRRFRLKIYDKTVPTGEINSNENNVELQIESNHWEDMEEDFFRLLEGECDRNTIKLLHAIIWLSLTTYAWEDYDSICGAFYNGIYYLEELLG